MPHTMVNVGESSLLLPHLRKDNLISECMNPAFQTLAEREYNHEAAKVSHPSWCVCMCATLWTVLFLFREIELLSPPSRKSFGDPQQAVVLSWTCSCWASTLLSNSHSHLGSLSCNPHYQTSASPDFCGAEHQISLVIHHNTTVFKYVWTFLLQRCNVQSEITWLTR